MPFTRPSTVIVVPVPMLADTTDQFEPSVERSTLYPLMVAPPVEPGAAHVRVTEPSPVDDSSPSGAVAGAPGLVLMTSGDPMPAAVIALMRNQ